MTFRGGRPESRQRQSSCGADQPAERNLPPGMRCEALECGSLLPLSSLRACSRGFQRCALLAPSKLAGEKAAASYRTLKLRTHKKAGGIVYPRVRYNGQEFMQAGPGNSPCRAAFGQFGKAPTGRLRPGPILTMSINQDVGIPRAITRRAPRKPCHESLATPRRPARAEDPCHGRKPCAV